MSSHQHLHTSTTSAQDSCTSLDYPVLPTTAQSNHTTTVCTIVAGHKRHNGDEHITFDNGAAIDANWHEIRQEPYNGGIGVERGADMRIDYRPHGFTLGMVLAGVFCEISDPDVGVVGLQSARWPEKASFHLEFCEPAFGGPFREQRRVKKGPHHIPTRKTFAMFVAEGMRKMLERRDLSWFPYTLDEIKIVSIDVRSRGTLQPRIFVDFPMVQDRLDASWDKLLRELY
ncbi:hypothetical protein V8D89_012943 [Ganoderma adspersum]